jgi:hypothetical protein
VAPVAELAQQPEINYLQMMINVRGTIAFARVIVPAGRSRTEKATAAFAQEAVLS